MQNLIDEHINDFVNRHKKFGAVKSDRRYKYMKSTIGQWLEAIETSHRMYFLKLFSKFEYYGTGRIAIMYKKLYDYYIKNYGSEDDTVFYVVEKTTGMFNAANHLMFQFQMTNDVSSLRLYSNARLSYQNEDYSTVKNIVLVDDIVGSGSTFKNYIRNLIKDCPEIFGGRKIYILVLATVPDGKEFLYKFAKKNNLDLTILPTLELTKAFKEDYIFSCEECNNISKIIRNYEEKIAERKDDIMGFRESEALIAFHYNTPNNTLCTFWKNCEKHNWKSIFPRREDDYSKALPRKNMLQEIREKKEAENNVNYNLKAVKAIV